VTAACQLCHIRDRQADSASADKSHTVLMRTNLTRLVRRLTERFAPRFTVGRTSVFTSCNSVLHGD